MYPTDICDATTEPTFAPTGISDTLLAEMASDLAELRRLEACITPEELEAMEQLYCAEQAKQQRNETRVSVAGRRYRAEARVASGQWVKAGTHKTEVAAWQAASDKLARMAGTERMTA